jgi:hypothetical protein
MGLQKQSMRRKKEEGVVMSRKVKQTKLTLSDLIIPLASLFLLVVLSFAVFIPMISSAFDYIEEIKVTEEKIEQLEETMRQLDTLNEIQMNEDVLIARKVIPKVLLVSNFVYYLDNLAKEKDLEVSNLSTADSTNTVSGPLEYSGAFIDVISFLEEVQEVSPYMIRLENVEVSIREEEERRNEVWKISLSVSGYHYAESNAEPSVYAPFQLYTQYEDIVQIFRRKAGSL